MHSVHPALNGGDICEAARATVAALSKYGLKSCLFGSAACAIYGTQNREPNVCTLPSFTLSQVAFMELNQDVDIIVLSEMKPEDIKELVVTSDDRFYLSWSRRNTSKALCFRVSNYKKCKVEILIPGRPSIPNIPINKISYIESFQEIPVVPFLVLLLLKLRSWTDHRIDHRQYVRDKDKFEADEEDMKELLDLAVQGYRAHLDDEKWLPKWFIRDMQERVQEYIKVRPISEENWKTVGF